MDNIGKCIANLCILLFFFLLTGPVFATTDVLIINLIRGAEACCNPGTAEMIERINSDEKLKQLSIGWALRHDALMDEDMVKHFTSLPGGQEVGILLEVTPQLASQSGVVYKGDTSGSDWKDADRVFLIGYTQEERRQLIDTVFAEFYHRFSQYPSFTVSWMIDSWSLEYLREQYAVAVHEITKEQYETDNYTLYGGVFNRPYFASRGHILIPGKKEDLGILIVRQTVSDLVRNYGSTKTYYTSQPNDYLSNPESEGFDYFSYLFDEVGQQEVSSRFALLGLENSQEWVGFKEEFLKQLTFVVDKQAQGVLNVFSPQDYYKKVTSEDIVFSRQLKSSGFPQNGVVWYFGDTYRARLEVIDGSLALSDLRIFSPGDDPYRDIPALKNKAFYIVPYIIDSSQMFFETNTSGIGDTKNNLSNGTETDRFGLVLLSSGEYQMKVANDTVEVGGNGTVYLEPTQIVVKNSDPMFAPRLSISLSQLLEWNTIQYLTISNHPRLFLVPDKNTHTVTMGWETGAFETVVMLEAVKSENQWRLTPRSNLSLGEKENLVEIFQPDRISRKIDPQRSTFFWHNREAIAGRNPVRLFVDPRSTLGRSVSLSQFYLDVKGDAVTVNYPGDLSRRLDPFLVDITASQSSQATVTIIADGNIIKDSITLYFYHDCQKEWLGCLREQKELQGFIKVWARGQTENLKQSALQIVERIKAETQKFMNTIEKSFSH